MVIEVPAWVTRRRVVRTLVILALLALVVLVYNGFKAVRAVDAMQSDASSIAEHLGRGDLPGARAAANTLRGHADTADGATHGVVWTIATWVPFVGDNFDAVATSARVADAIARHSMPTFLDLADQVQNGKLKPIGGRMDPAAVAAQTPAVKTAAKSVDGPALAMAKIRPQDLVPPLDGFIADFQKQVATAKSAADAAANAFSVLPNVLGADGPHDYLLLVQQPAEIRSAGGLPGTWAIIHAEDGKLTMTQDKDSLLGGVQQVVPLTQEESDLLGSNFGLDPRDITADPHFPRVAEIAAAKLKEHTGISVSAVFSVDPVALSYVLRGTGAVTVPTSVAGPVTLNADNAGSVLMNWVYMVLPVRDDQQKVLSDSAHAVFDALVHGQGNEANAIRGLVIAAMQHRVFAWSDQSDLASVIGAEQLGGAMAGDDGVTPHVGVYLNDDVLGKPDYYLQQSSQVKSTSCGDGVQHLTLTTTFRNTMPANAASLPIWVVGDGSRKPKGVIAMTVFLASPFHGSIDSLTVNGKASTVTSDPLYGRTISVLPVDMKPGELLTLTATMTTGPGQLGNGMLTWTPGMELANNPAQFLTSC